MDGNLVSRIWANDILFQSDKSTGKYALGFSKFFLQIFDFF